MRFFQKTTLSDFWNIRQKEKKNRPYIQIMGLSKAYLGNIILVFLIVNAMFVIPWFFRYLFEDHNLRIMNELNDPILHEELRANMTQNYNFTELLDWVHKYIKWVDIGKLANRSTNPLEILESGKGHCGEFALVYLAGCLSLGYEARWLVSVRPYTYQGLHNWVEVKVDKSWIHVDPTERIWNKPSMYKDGNWWGIIGKDAFVYAFEKGKIDDVTARYS